MKLTSSGPKAPQPRETDQPFVKLTSPLLAIARETDTRRPSGRGRGRAEASPQALWPPSSGREMRAAARLTGRGEGLGVDFLRFDEGQGGLEVHGRLHGGAGPGGGGRTSRAWANACLRWTPGGPSAGKAPPPRAPLLRGNFGLGKRGESSAGFPRAAFALLSCRASSVAARRALGCVSLPPPLLSARAFLGRIAWARWSAPPPCFPSPVAVCRVRSAGLPRRGGGREGGRAWAGLCSVTAAGGGGEGGKDAPPSAQAACFKSPARQLSPRPAKLWEERRGKDPLRIGSGPPPNQSGTTMGGVCPVSAITPKSHFYSALINPE